MTRVVIAAAGRDKWWTGDIPRHLVPVDGVPLLARTIRQVRQWTDDVHLTVPPDDWRYRLADVTVHERGDDHPSEYASTRDLWSATTRTVLLLGDVYWTDDAIRKVLTDRAQDYRCYGRCGPSKVTGTPYGEIFAAAWWPRQIPALDRHLKVVHDTRAAGTITRPPGWMLLRSWQGTPMNRHRVRPPHWVELPDDGTDDIDKVEDYERHPAMRGGAGVGAARS